MRTENTTISGTLVSDRMGLGTGGLQNAVAQANADFVAATFVRVATTEGNIDIELFNEDAPVTVANFLNYLSRYAGTIIHRTADLDPNTAGVQGIMQGGGFRPAAITLDSAIANEFNAANSNVRGTLSRWPCRELTSTGEPVSGSSTVPMTTIFSTTASTRFLAESSEMA